MALQYVTLTGDYTDGEGAPLWGTLTFTPSTTLADTADDVVIRPRPIQVSLSDNGTFTARLLATDNASLLPAGWTWQVSEAVAGQVSASWSFYLPYASGAVQDISSLLATPAVTPPLYSYMPVAGGQFTGAVACAESGLADGAVISVNASAGTLFRVTLAGNRTLANPSGGFDGQLIRVEVTQDSAGGWALAYDPAYDFGTAGTPVLSTAPGATDVLGFACDAAAGTWLCLAFAQGY